MAFQNDIKKNEKKVYVWCETARRYILEVKKPKKAVKKKEKVLKGENIETK